MCALHKLILTMIDPIMLRVPDINQSVVTAPTVRVDGGVNRASTANNGLQSRLFTVRDNLGINAAVTFEDAEDYCLATSSAASLATNTASAEVRLINFDFAVGERRGALAFFSDALTDFEKDRGDATARESDQFGCMSGRQIKREVAKELAHFTLRNFRPPVVAVSLLHLRSLALRIKCFASLEPNLI